MCVRLWQPARNMQKQRAPRKAPRVNHEGILLVGQSMQSKAIRYWQIASMVGESGEARTINLCQECYIEKLVQQGEQPLKLWQWRGAVEKKAHIWKVGVLYS